jgi:hypothetical protein
MQLRYQFAVLLLSMAGAAMAQQESHLVGPGKRGNFNGISHIEVELGQKNALVVGFTTFDKVTARQNVDSVLRLFVADYQKVADTAQATTQATHALYRLGPFNRTADLRYTPQTTATFRFSDGQPDPVLVKTRQDTLQIVWSSAITPLPYYDFSLYLLVNNLSDIARMLQEGGINGKLQEALKSVRQYKHHDLTNPKMAFDLRYKREGESIQTQFINPGLAKSPFISFQPSIGVGLIRTQWVPSLNLDVQFIPNRFKGIGYSVGYLSNFYFQNQTDGRFPIQQNGFLTLGVAFYRNRTTKPGPAFDNLRTSFSVGVLVRNAGNVFPKGTIRLSSTLYQKGFLKIQPELYFDGAFKNVYPGLRVGFGL